MFFVVFFYIIYLFQKIILSISNVKLCTLNAPKYNYGTGSVELNVAHKIHAKYIIKKYKITIKIFKKEYMVNALYFASRVFNANLFTN